MNEMLANKKNNLNSKIHVEFSNDIFEIPYDENKKIFQLKFYFKNNKLQFLVVFYFYLIILHLTVKNKFQKNCLIIITLLLYIKKIYLILKIHLMPSHL